MDYRVPYVVLVSKVIEHFSIDLEGELTEIVKAHNEITCSMKHKIGLQKINDDHWVCGVHVGAKD